MFLLLIVFRHLSMLHNMASHTCGVIIGRFNPPHNGHRYLIDFASAFVDKLHIFVCTLPQDKIKGRLRFDWIRKLYPDAKVIHITEENPKANRNQPGAHEIWAKTINEHMPSHGPSHLFASEKYGWKLAKQLGALFVPVDPNRNQLPLSGAEVRANPLRYWNFMPEIVRTYFLKRLLILAGSNSQTIARDLAIALKTVYVHNYSSFYLEFTYKTHVSPEEDIKKSIGKKAQQAIEAALSLQANRFLILNGIDIFENSKKINRTRLLNSDRIIVLENLLDDEQKTLLSATLQNDTQLTKKTSFFHRSENIIENIQTDIFNSFCIERDIFFS